MRSIFVILFEIAHREPRNECINPHGQWPQIGTVRSIAQKEHAAAIRIDPVRQLGQVGLDMRNLYSRHRPTFPLDNRSGTDVGYVDLHARTGKRSTSPHVPVVADVVFPTRNDIRKESAVIAKEAIHEFDCRSRTKDSQWRKIAAVEIEPQQGKAREINDMIRVMVSQENRIHLCRAHSHACHLVGCSGAAINHDSIVTYVENAGTPVAFTHATGTRTTVTENV